LSARGSGAPSTAADAGGGAGGGAAEDEHPVEPAGRDHARVAPVGPQLKQRAAGVGAIGPVHQRRHRRRAEQVIGADAVVFVHARAALRRAWEDVELELGVLA
jgi:hypothetical protein